MDVSKDQHEAATCLTATFARHATLAGIIEPADETWARNTLLAAIGEPGTPAIAGINLEAPLNDEQVEDLVAQLEAIAQANSVAPVVGEGSFGFLCHLTGLIMPRPSEVAQKFEALRNDSGNPRSATEWFHKLCGDVGYIRRARIAKNICWETPTQWGDLELTINLSKPEKDPRAIAAAASITAGEKYPACALCVENEGYAGRSVTSSLGAHSPRQNLRIIPLELGGEQWGLQYSPYAYYNEHCIVMSTAHEPMSIGWETFQRLLQFTDELPHYFVGSNADLPIVGGSILAHNHFQGGRHAFPMDKAPIENKFTIDAYPQVKAGIVRWPMTVLRLECADASQLVDAACHVLEAWRNWDAPEVGVSSRTDDTPHNTITPIARKIDSTYRLDLVLRCNITSDEHPLGVFHPHEDLHHIKRENIGLIEVMGLAILPPRLKQELSAVGDALTTGANLEADELTASHAAWAREVAARHSELNATNVDAVLRDEVGAVFARVLVDAGVFKWDTTGRSALQRFLDAL